MFTTWSKERVDPENFPDYRMFFQCFRTRTSGDFIRDKESHERMILASILLNADERVINNSISVSFSFAGFNHSYGRYPNSDDDIKIQYVKWLAKIPGSYGLTGYDETWCRWSLNGSFTHGKEKNVFKVPYFLQDFHKIFNFKKEL